MKQISFLPALLPVLLLAGCGELQAPMPDSSARPVALRFGMYVTPDPEQNPIDPPERFTGYHVGLDYEIHPDELQEEVPVYAICHGSVLYSAFAEGYGGLVVQRCNIKGEEVGVLYGHLDENGMAPEGEVIKPGMQLGVLAPDRTLWSGWNRKHLHLGIHRGAEADLRGYVQTEEEIATFMDPSDVLPGWANGKPVEEYSPPGPRNRDDARPDDFLTGTGSSSQSS